MLILLRWPRSSCQGTLCSCMGVCGCMSALKSQRSHWCCCSRSTPEPSALLSWDHHFYFLFIYLFIFPVVVESWQVCSSWQAVWGLCHCCWHVSSLLEQGGTKIMSDRSFIKTPFFNIIDCSIHQYASITCVLCVASTGCLRQGGRKDGKI